MAELVPVTVKFLLIAVLFDAERHVRLLYLHFLLGLFHFTSHPAHLLVPFHLLDIACLELLLNPSLVNFLNRIEFTIGMVHFVVGGVEYRCRSPMDNFHWTPCMVPHAHHWLSWGSTTFVVI